jgi:hypothetical protein
MPADSERAGSTLLISGSTGVGRTRRRKKGKKDRKGRKYWVWRAMRWVRQPSAGRTGARLFFR